MKHSTTGKSLRVHSILRTTVLASALTAGLGMQAAFSEPLIYVPMGDEGKILVVDGATDKIVNTIGGVAAIHGLAKTPDGRFLVAGSFEAREPGSKAPEKPAKMSAKDHAAHHPGMAMKDKGKTAMTMAGKAKPGMAMKDKAKTAMTMAGKAKPGMAMKDKAKTAMTMAGKAKPGMAMKGKSKPHMAMQGKNSGKVISTVTVIQVKDNSIVRRIDVPGAVHHVAISPDGKFAVVSNPSEGTISAINLDTYEIAATVATGALPNFVVFSPTTGRAYVTNGGDNTISEFDTTTWKATRKFTTGDGPGHLVMSDDGQNIYVANGNDGTVSEISVKDGVSTRTFKIGDMLHGIDISNDAKTLFVSALEQDKLVAIDLKTRQKRNVSVPTPYHLAAVGGTNKLYVSSSDEPEIKVIDQTSLAVLGTISIGGKGHQMALSPGS